MFPLDTNLVCRNLSNITVNLNAVTAKFFQRSKTHIRCEHRLFIGKLETDRFVFFFLHSSFVLEYAESSNQRDFLPLGLLSLRIYLIKSV